MRFQHIVLGTLCLVSLVFGANTGVASNKTTNENTTVSLAAPVPNDGVAHAQKTQSNANVSCVGCNSK
jgi:hypothetical protein